MEYPQNLKKYDYIFAGGGMAALSLAYYLNHSSLRDKTFLIIDREIKNTNDHTYCFWEKGESVFDPIVTQKWNKFWFNGANNFNKLLDIEPFNYKMIKAIDFYKFIIENLRQNKNYTFLQAEVLEIHDFDQTFVKTTNGQFEANELVIDSIFRPKYNKPEQNNLWQHFKGYVIETVKPIFKPKEPTLFDFRIPQNNECRFVYVLPESTNKALIEFTIFSEFLMDKNEYDIHLKDYIQNKINIESTDYQILETEFGVIPMSDEVHELWPSAKVLRIGTAGGFVKSSTGYSFQRTQGYLQKLVKHLEKGDLSKNYVKASKWKQYLDSVLLRVMKENWVPQDEIFTALFQKNKASEVLNFLNEDSSLWQDIKLMNTVPKWPFIKAAFSEMNKLFKK